MIDQGLLPQFGKIRERGVTGHLLSTMPPYTAPGWVSCVTGVNPGKHGVFGFTQRVPADAGDGSGKTFVSRRAVQSPQVWRYVNEAGKTAGLINIPVTYPAEEVNGFMVPCFLTPWGKTDYTYPTALYQDLIREIGTYVINVRIAEHKAGTEGEFDHFVKELHFATQKRFEAMQYLWARYHSDFFMIVFTCMDKIQHKFWKYLDVRHPLYATPEAEKARQGLVPIYQLMDRVAGYIIDRLDPETTLYLVSDHGFGSMDKRVFINQWLEQQDLLSIHKGKFYMEHLMARTPLARAKSQELNIAVAENAIDRCIDFSKTRFYCSDVYEQGVYFNDGAGDGPEEKKRQLAILRDKLMGLKDPETGERFVDEACLREELYWGPHVEQAPEVLLRMRNYGYLMATSIPFRGKEFIRTVHGPEGCHRPEGVFAAFGAQVVPQRDYTASIMDVTPTVLYQMGVDVPRDMDGKVLADLFTSDFRRDHEIRYRDEALAGAAAKTERDIYSIEEEKEIEGRLKDLGYFD
jgi:predicted AlkP superfamily phosphohydrolase/phosphomutase